MVLQRRRKTLGSHSDSGCWLGRPHQRRVLARRIAGIAPITDILAEPVAAPLLHCSTPARTTPQQCVVQHYTRCAGGDSASRCGGCAMGCAAGSAGSATLLPHRRDIN